MPSPIAQLFVGVDANISGALKGLNTLHDQMLGAAASMATAGQLAAAAITVPVVGATAAIVNFGASFEHAFTGVRKTVDEASTDMAALQKGILDLSTRNAGGGKSAEQLAGIAEIAGSMGIEGAANILKFIETVAGISVATGLAEDQVSRDMAAFLVAVGLPIAEIDRLGSTVVDLGNKTAATEGQINEFNLRLAGALATVGATPQEINGISATLGSLQINAEAGGTAISKFFTDMTSAAAGSGGKIADNTQKVRELQDKITDLGGSLQAATDRQKAFGRNTPAATVSATADAVERYKRELGEAQADLQKVNSTQGKAVGSAEQFARVAGISTDAFKELVKTNPTEAFTRIIEGIARIREAEGPAAALGALADIGIDDSRMRDALLRLSAGHEALRKNVLLANAAWDSNTAAQIEVDKAMQDTTNQFNLLTNQIKRQLIDGWFQLKPIVLEVMVALGGIVPMLQRALGWFKGLTPEMQRNVIIWAAIAAAAGPVLIILGALVGALAALLSPISLVVVAVAGLAAVWATNMGDIQGKTAGVVAFIMEKWGQISPLLGKLFSFFATLWVLQVTVAERALREIAGFFTTILMPAFQAIGGWIAGFLLGPFLEALKWIQGVMEQLFGLGAADDATRKMMASQGINLGEGQSAASLFDAGIRSGDLALANLSQGIAAGGPGTANNIVVNLNNPTITDQTVAERFAAEVKEQVMWAIIEAERGSTVPPPQVLPGVPF